jgi:hypothetical protein
MPEDARAVERARYAAVERALESRFQAQTVAGWRIYTVEGR